MPDILILHGWGSCAKNWQKVKELLEKEGIKVFLSDLPGFGENPPLSQPWSIDDYANWVNDFVKKNNLDQFFLLGHSFGGAIAVSYILKFPQNIKKLILISPALIRVKELDKEILAKIAKLLSKLSFLPFYSLVRRAFYRFVVKSDYPDIEGPMRETYLKVIKQDFSEYLSSIFVPTLLIWGEKDSTTPLKDAYFVKEKIARAELKILPDIRHNPHRDAPEKLSEIILNFLRS